MVNTTNCPEKGNTFFPLTVRYKCDFDTFYAHNLIISILLINFSFIGFISSFWVLQWARTQLKSLAPSAPEPKKFEHCLLGRLAYKFSSNFFSRARRARGRFFIFSAVKVSERVDLHTSRAHIFSRARGASGRFLSNYQNRK